MGGGASSHKVIEKKELEFDNEGNIPYIPNVNRYGDSDYDDEVDDVDLIAF